MCLLAQAQGRADAPSDGQGAREGGSQVYRRKPARVRGALPDAVVLPHLARCSHLFPLCWCRRAVHPLHCCRIHLSKEVRQQGLDDVQGFMGKEVAKLVKSRYCAKGERGYTIACASNSNTNTLWPPSQR